tara:strand:+ start:28 stop:297 length:270 start_codon:yes stop_codon:yes gene_type:complete
VREPDTPGKKYPNRNPAWKQAQLIIDFQGFARKDSSASLSGEPDTPGKKYPIRNPAWKQALLTKNFQGFIREGSSTPLSAGPMRTKNRL